MFGSSIHRGLPVKMRAIGDQMAQSEFRQHYDAIYSPKHQEHLRDFFVQWNDYYRQVCVCCCACAHVSIRLFDSNVHACVDTVFVQISKQVSDQQMNQTADIYDASPGLEDFDDVGKHLSHEEQSLFSEEQIQTLDKLRKRATTP
jgi:hypothetical protein